MPAVYDSSVVDDTVHAERFAAARAVAATEGLLVGISSGRSMWLQVARRPEMAGKNVVVLRPTVASVISPPSCMYRSAVHSVLFIRRSYKRPCKPS